MKRPLAAIISAAFAGASVHANIAIPQEEIHTCLVHEEVDINIIGVQAEVTGTFNFEYSSPDYFDLTFYLPVYAAEGTPVKEMKPVIRMGGKEIDVVFVKKEWEANPAVTGFGKLPQLEGQRVYWFMIPHVARQPEKTQLTLKIGYTQKLADGKFIYTPLIPKMKKDHDYGSISISGDRPLTLLDPDQHNFTKDGDKIVVESAHKRAIVVDVGGSAGDQVP